MDIFSIVKGIAAHSNEIWAQVLIVIAALGALLKGLEAILSIIAPLTPWKFDNDLADLLAKVTTAKIFNRNK